MEARVAGSDKTPTETVSAIMTIVRVSISIWKYFAILRGESYGFHIAYQSIVC